MNLSIFSAFFGHLLEVHDKALFAFLAPFIASYFFEGEASASAILKIYGVIAFSLLFRPIGALFFGCMGDRLGRKKSLLFTIFGMSIVTFAMGFIPSFETAGIFSSLSIALLRALQYFFAAGEMTNGGVYLIEHSKSRFKGFMGSLFEAATMGGIFIASLETSLLAYFGVLESHWQWLFIGAGLLGIVGFFLRKKMVESLEYLHAKQEPPFDWKDLWRYKGAIFGLSILTAFSYATYIFSITFINAYLKLLTPLTESELTWMTTFMSLIDFLALPVFGLLALYLTDFTLMFTAAVITMVSAVPLFFWMTHSVYMYEIVIARFCIMCLGCSFSALKPWFQQKLFPVKKRCSLLNISSAAGQLISEGPLTIVSLLAINSGWELMPGFLLAALAAGAAIAVWKMRKSVSG